MLLAELGARVIKIEEPGVGDYYRAAPGSSALLGDQVDVINAGKESLGLNLKAPEGREVFLKLVRKADVVLESFRPGVLKKLGLDFAVLKKVRPKIILCSITGFGRNRKKSNLAGHDLNFLAMTGLLSRIRDATGRLVIPDFQIVDLATGYESAMKIAAALAMRKRGGHLDVSMEGAAASLSRLYSVPTPLAGSMSRYGVYETSDGGWVTLAALEPKFWTKFCRVISREESVSREELQEVFHSKSLEDWRNLGEKEDVCLFPVNENPSRRLEKAFPALGTHTVSILRKMGYTSQQIRLLKERGIVD